MSKCSADLGWTYLMILRCEFSQVQSIGSDLKDWDHYN